MKVISVEIMMPPAERGCILDDILLIMTSSSKEAGTENVSVSIRAFLDDYFQSIISRSFFCASNVACEFVMCATTCADWIYAFEQVRCVEW